ncbi:hypothetical protein D3C81_1434200 [compost metagenome]
MPADARVGVVQARFVNAAMAQLGTHLPVELEGFREEIQAATVFAFLQRALLGFLVDMPLADGAAVGHHQQRAGDLLGVAGAAGDVLQHAIAIGLPLADQAVDHQQGNQQEQDQAGNGAELDGQGAVHWEVSPVVAMRRVSVAEVEPSGWKYGDCVEITPRAFCRSQLAGDQQRLPATPSPD